MNSNSALILIQSQYSNFKSEFPGDSGASEEEGLVPAEPSVHAEGRRGGVSRLLLGGHVQNTHPRAQA